MSAQQHIKEQSTAAPRSTSARVVDLFVKLYVAARRSSQQLKEQYGVTATQLGVIKLLARHGPQTQSTLAELLMVKGSTVSGLVDRLEREGLVIRERDTDDRRAVFVVLSEKAREMARSVPYRQLGKLRDCLDDLSRKELGAFARIMEKLVTSLEAQNEVTAVDELLEEPKR